MKDERVKAILNIIKNATFPKCIDVWSLQSHIWTRKTGNQNAYYNALACMEKQKEKSVSMDTHGNCT